MPRRQLDTRHQPKPRLADRVLIEALKTEIATRDAFLARVAQGLEGRTKALGESLVRRSLIPAARDALQALEGFSRELSLIAVPDAEVPPGPRLDLSRVVRDLVDAHRKRALQGGRDLRVVAPGRVYVACRHGDLETVLMELVSNCLKYGRGPVTISVSTTRSHAQLTVRDEGAGVSTRYEPRRFARGVTRGAPGFGVGLWLVRRIAMAHGGKLTLAGAEGVQVTFGRA